MAVGQLCPEASVTVPDVHDSVSDDSPSAWRASEVTRSGASESRLAASLPTAPPSPLWVPPFESASPPHAETSATAPQTAGRRQGGAQGRESEREGPLVKSSARDVQHADRERNA